MMQFKKMMVSLGVLVCLCTNFSAVAYANTTTPFSDYGISVAYEIAESPISTLNIIGRTAYCDSSTTGTNAISITVTQTLQKHWGLWIWTDVKDAVWTEKSNYNSISVSGSKSDLENGTYRVKSVFTLTNSSGKKETITIYSNEDKVL